MTYREDLAATTTDALLAFARRSGFITVREACVRGIDAKYIQRLTARGILTRVSRGVYELADADFTEHHTLV